MRFPFFNFQRVFYHPRGACTPASHNNHFPAGRPIKFISQQFTTRSAPNSRCPRLPAGFCYLRALSIECSLARKRAPRSRAKKREYVKIPFFPAAIHVYMTLFPLVAHADSRVSSETSEEKCKQLCVIYIYIFVYVLDWRNTLRGEAVKFRMCEMRKR